MPNLDDLLDANDPKQHLQRLGDVFDAFEDQDSGCMSYGVAIQGDRWFVKTAYTAQTVPMLRRAADFHLNVQHDAIVAPAAYAERPNRAAILYPWVDGKVLYHPTRTRYLSREDPLSPMYAFRLMPVEKIHRALDTVFDAHLAVVESGFVAIDFYDGSMLYDPDSESMYLIDLDEYRAGQFVVGPELLSGSVRFFSPEETSEAPPSTSAPLSSPWRAPPACCSTAAITSRTGGAMTSNSGSSSKRPIRTPAPATRRWLTSSAPGAKRRHRKRTCDSARRSGQRRAT